MNRNCIYMGTPLLMSLIIDNLYYQQLRYHAIFNFSYVGLTPLPIPHTPSSPVTIVFDLFYLLLYSWFFLLYFCKFLGCHGCGLFSLPSQDLEGAQNSYKLHIHFCIFTLRFINFHVNCGYFSAPGYSVGFRSSFA